MGLASPFEAPATCSNGPKIAPYSPGEDDPNELSTNIGGFNKGCIRGNLRRDASPESRRDAYNSKTLVSARGGS